MAAKPYFLSLARVKRRHLVEQVLCDRQAGRERLVISCLFCDSSAQLLRKLKLVMKCNLPIRSQRRCTHSIYCDITKYVTHLPDHWKVLLVILTYVL
jgi:hypothetical protein